RVRDGLNWPRVPPPPARYQHREPKHSPQAGSCTIRAKTRIVHMTEGGEGLDFLGFHHRWVRGDTPASRHLCFLARWPSRQAIQRARNRICELTDRRRLLLNVDEIVQDVNRFLHGWAGYFRYGNSAR